MKNKKIYIVGAGLSGATIARLLAEQGAEVSIFEQRDHVAGNCYDARCPHTRVREHRYGPHIFHTNDEDVWQFVQRFARFMPYQHRVFTTSQGQVWNLPVNLHTLNQFRATAMTPNEARKWLASMTISTPGGAENLQQHAHELMGAPLYETFFRDYTEKQWGCPATQLPASVLKRLPFRFDYTDGYFDSRFQGMPEDGYTAMVQSMLQHPNILVQTDLTVTAEMARELMKKGHVFWSGPLDAWFNHDAGRLRWRTLDFVREAAKADAQGCAVMNYADKSVPWTRITDHARLSPWEQHQQTLLVREIPREAKENDIPYYPLRMADDERLLTHYRERASALNGVTFIGRLGTYRYMDMDVTLRQAMSIAKHFMTTPAGERFLAWPDDNA